MSSDEGTEAQRLRQLIYLLRVEGLQIMSGGTDTYLTGVDADRADRWYADIETLVRTVAAPDPRCAVKRIDTVTMDALVRLGTRKSCPAPCCGAASDFHGAIMYNPWNRVVQCHACWAVYELRRDAEGRPEKMHKAGA